MTDQPDLFHSVPGVALKHTVASKRGTQWVEQCAWCGTLVCVVKRSDEQQPQQLGPCPACGKASWWFQHVPPDGIGMFKLEEES